MEGPLEQDRHSMQHDQGRKIGPGENITIDAPLGHIPVYIRGGSVLPTQEPGMTTTACRQNPWGVIVALGANSEAIGELYVDDGESLNPNVTLIVEFTVSGSSLYASGKGGYTDSNALANVTVLGVETTPADVKFNNVKLGKSWSYNSTNKVLTVTELNNATSTGAWSQDWILSWN